MFTPLNFRRLAWFLSWFFFGAGLASWDYSFQFVLLMLASLLCSFLKQAIQSYYGPAVEPLVPDLRIRTRVRAGYRRLATWYAALTKGNKLLVLAIGAVAGFLFLPPLFRVFPTLGGFAPDTLNAYTLGAAQYFLALTLAYVSWRWLFPSLYAYAAETMEGKLLESIVGDLLALLPTHAFDEFNYALAAERRKIATLQFVIRCVRFVFSISPFVCFFLAANAALTAALTAVPAGA